ncbi:hypothetical protein MSC49_16050 [Methylosinus sp. C49]|uniref:helix-turn-helix domain-containing protein n=1 Tax=Methylosinus sp. C49 TaxID=2699395 RepID=UPI0013674392|nr:helix-turn-helix domain-containing protein [Methylosinus sp. C49]BBU61670.1 hypothetical protein MSC49_16050 [Methylosinus sp. C49]
MKVKKVFEKFKSKEYRDAYVGAHVRRWIAHQIRALREAPERNWKQGELAERMGRPQSVVSRLEDPSYGKMTVQTLLATAAAFDVALIIKFVDYKTFLGEAEDLSSSRMEAHSFDNAIYGQQIITASMEELNIFERGFTHVYTHIISEEPHESRLQLSRTLNEKTFDQIGLNPTRSVANESVARH